MNYKFLFVVAWMSIKYGLAENVPVSDEAIKMLKQQFSKKKQNNDGHFEEINP